MRVYLDHNATTPLRSEARDAMIAAMDIVGNASSVHAEGRAAKGLLERARGTIASALGADGADVIFVSGATEGAALALAHQTAECSDIEHEAVSSWCQTNLPADEMGQVDVTSPETTALQYANSETGIIQKLPEGILLCDMTQAFGKHPIAFNWSGATMALVSAHKLGGPKGIGALVVKRGTDIPAQILGGGQEMGRRSGTENIIGIAGFAAAAEAATRDLALGKWEKVEKLRNILELGIAQSANKTIFVGKDADRLPNTSCFITEGWRGETQVMQMDLSGFAVSAGSACSSGKVKSSRVLRAMGFDEMSAGCALRVSLGLETTEEQVLAFVDAWSKHHERFRARAG